MALGMCRRGPLIRVDTLSTASVSKSSRANSSWKPSPDEDFFFFSADALFFFSDEGLFFSDDFVVFSVCSLVTTGLLGALCKSEEKTID